MSSYLEAAREIEIIDDVDVLVVGGGPAGVCAAVGAARAGASTFLVERHGFLGGMWTAGLVLTLAGYNSWLRPYHRCVAGVGGEWLRRAAALGGAEDNNGWALNSDPETMKLVADALLEEAGARCLLHSWGARPIVEAGRVGGLLLENVDGRTAIRARVMVDCTGNGDLVARAGGDWVKSNTLQPMTMAFRIGYANLDPAYDVREPAFIPIGPEPLMLQEPLLSDWASRRHDVPVDRIAMQAARRRGEIPSFGGPWFGGMEKDIAWVNTVRVYGDASIAAELTRAEIKGRRDMFALMNYFRLHVPGLENGRIVQAGSQIGVRETRRLTGLTTLTGDDVHNRRAFEDSIAVGCWPIDVHPADGVVGVHGMDVVLPYGIPYRALVPQHTDGLLAAGRCISVDRQALGTARVGATCAATGQAAGAAAALAARSGIPPRQVPVDRLRELLRDQGAIVDPPGA